MSIHDKDILAPVTIAGMVEAYENACRVVREAYPKIAEAELQLERAFGSGIGHNWRLVGDRDGSFRKYHSWEASRPGDYVSSVIDDIRRSAWRDIVERVGARKMMTEARIRQMNEQIEKGEVKDVSIATVMEFLADLGASAPEIQHELMRSAYESLMPPKWGALKTDERIRNGGLQRKVVVHGVVKNGYGRPFHVDNYRENKIAEIDKAFHLLDGQGVPDGYITPLVDAINVSEDGRGRTSYFEFRAFKNGNLHLTILREDLIAEFNRRYRSWALSKGKDM